MASTISRERRTANLEQKKRYRTPVAIPLIVAESGEDSDDAVARYVAEHGPLPEVEDGDVNVIVMVPVAPMPRVA